MQRALQASASDLQWFIDSYALVFAGLLLPAGALGDRFGRRGALQVGLAIFAGAAVLSSLAGSPEEVIAFRAVISADHARHSSLRPARRKSAPKPCHGPASPGQGARSPVTSGLLLEG